jgi:hypothetical protein
MNVRSQVYASKHQINFNFLEDLETHDFIELNWKCPGRKTPQQKAEEAPKVEAPKEQ